MHRVANRPRASVLVVAVRAHSTTLSPHATSRSHFDADMFTCIILVGLALAVPEVVPFRLTPNMVNAFGINGYDGDFRKVCEVIVRIMRSNQGAVWCGVVGCVMWCGVVW